MELQHLPTRRREIYKFHPELAAARPPSVGYCLESGVYQYEGTCVFQWWTTGPSPYWKPYGKQIHLTRKEQLMFLLRYRELEQERRKKQRSLKGSELLPFSMDEFKKQIRIMDPNEGTRILFYDNDMRLVDIIQCDNTSAFLRKNRQPTTRVRNWFGRGVSEETKFFKIDQYVTSITHLKGY